MENEIVEKAHKDFTEFGICPRTGEQHEWVPSGSQWLSGINVGDLVCNHCSAAKKDYVYLGSRYGELKRVYQAGFDEGKLSQPKG